jgi:hypothetical protein
LYDPAAQNYGPVALVVSDESSQATRWSTLGAAAAVRLSGRLVLVGDQDQLGQSTPRTPPTTPRLAPSWTSSFPASLRRQK